MVEAVLLAMAGPRFGCTSSLPPLLPLLMMMIALALTLKSPALARSHCSVRNATVAIEDTLCGTCYDVNTTICQGACVTKQSYALHGRSVQRACVYSEVRYEAALLPGCPARPRAATWGRPEAQHQQQTQQQNQQQQQQQQQQPQQQKQQQQQQPQQQQPEQQQQQKQQQQQQPQQPEQQQQQPQQQRQQEQQQQQPQQRQPTQQQQQQQQPQQDERQDRRERQIISHDPPGAEPGGDAQAPGDDSAGFVTRRNTRSGDGGALQPATTAAEGAPVEPDDESRPGEMSTRGPGKGTERQLRLQLQLLLLLLLR
ncbi:unnamed protein product [Lampetra planeri]